MVLYIRACVNCAGFQKQRLEEGSLARLLIPVAVMPIRTPSAQQPHHRPWRYVPRSSMYTQHVPTVQL